MTNTKGGSTMAETVHNTRDMYIAIFNYIDREKIWYYDNLIEFLRERGEWELFDFALEHYGPLQSYFMDPHPRW